MPRFAWWRHRAVRVKTMTLRHLFYVMLVTFAMVGCSDSRFRAASIANDVGIANLRADVRGLVGLLILPDAKSEAGPGGSGVSYERVGDGLFWCTEKLRMMSKTAKQR
jgi:hypothetical protein